MPIETLTAHAADESISSPPLTLSRVVVLALAGCLLAGAMNFNLVTHIGSVTSDSLDRYFQSWQLAWVGHAAGSGSAALLDSNTFWPIPNSLAFSDVVYGYAPAGLIGAGPEAAMVRYNLMFLFSIALAFFGAALLARELGVSWGAAAVGGAAFAFAPWRLAHLNHLHVLSSGGIPLALFLLLRGYRRSSAGTVIAGWAVAAWQLSLGFTLGLQFAYLLAVLGAAWFVRWLVRGRVHVPSRLILATGAGTVLFAAVGLLQGLPLLQVTHDHPESRRPIEFAALFSPPPSGFLAAPPDSVVWGGATRAVRDGLAWAPEMALFPGLTVLLLAAAGLGVQVLSRQIRLGLAAGIVVTAILCLGYSIANGRFTYNLLYEFAPGWQASRTPGRLFTLTSLGLALAGAAGAEGFRRSIDGKDGRRVLGKVTAGLAVTLLLGGAVLTEGRGRLSLVALPSAPPAVNVLPEPQLHLPTDDVNDPLYMLWSTDVFPRLFNGYSGFVPAAQRRMREQLRSFPDPATVAQLRSSGFRSVIVHRDRTAGTPWESISERSIEGLGLKTRSVGDLLVYELVR